MNIFDAVLYKLLASLFVQDHVFEMSRQLKPASIKS